MDYTYTTTPVDAAGVAAVIMSLIGFFIFVALIGYVVMSFILSRIFKKAGVEEWIAWVPIYNSWKLLEIGGQQGWWAVLSIIPIVNIISVVMILIAMYNIGLKLGKQGPFVLLGIFLPLVWYLWLAFDTSVWDESKGAPRLDTPVAPSTASTQPSAASPVDPEAPADNNQTPPTSPTA